MYFSAAQLVKRSTAQLLHFKKKAEAKPRSQGNEQYPQVGDFADFTSEAVEAGAKFARECAQSPFIEMCGSFKKSDFEIRFSVDEVRPTKSSIQFVEHKHVEGESPQWFFHSALIQTAFYGAMGQFVERLTTAAFVGEGHPVLHLDMDKRIKSILNFGGKAYRVSYNDIQVLKFFLAKATVVKLDNWTTAKKFDEQWKHKEWEWFKHHISYRRDKNLDFIPEAA